NGALDDNIGIVQGWDKNYNVFANDDFSNNNSASITSISFGATTVDTLSAGVFKIDGDYGTLMASQDGGIRYDALPNSEGVDVFSYTAMDSNGYTSIASISVNVRNDAPKGKWDDLVATQGEGIVGNVLDNDYLGSDGPVLVKKIIF
ncbi:MAG: Ig-like domain-containing protein, partial [Magnetococcus sp. WYHC-3]